MKIKYEFADETVEIEVSEEWGNILIDLDREEYNNDHKERRRHYHLEACAYDGEDFAVECKALSALFEGNDRLKKAVNKLSLKQRDIIRAVFYDDLTQKEYACLHDISISAASKLYRQAIKKLQLFLQKG